MSKRIVGYRLRIVDEHGAKHAEFVVSAAEVEYYEQDCPHSGLKCEVETRIEEDGGKVVTLKGFLLKLEDE